MALFTYPNVSIDTTGLATEAKQDSTITQLTNLNSKIAGDMFAIDHDFRDIDYVAAASVGEGQPETIILKTGGSGGSTVRTITFTYIVNGVGDEVVDTIDWS